MGEITKTATRVGDALGLRRKAGRRVAGHAGHGGHAPGAGALASPWGTAALVFAVVLALVASVFRGGNRHIPLIALEWLALLVLLAWGARALAAGRWPEGLGRGAVRAGLLLLAAAPLWVAALQWGVWPGLGVAVVTPVAGWHAALVGLTMSAFLLMGLGANAAHTHTLLKVWVGVAIAQSAVGFLQLGGFDLQFGAIGEGFRGTFAGKNSLANFLNLALPLVICWLLESLRGHQRHQGHRGHLGRELSTSDHKPWLLALALLTLLAALVASLSRAGVATGLLAALLAALVLPGRIRAAAGRVARSRGARLWLLSGAVALLLMVLLAVGLDWVEGFDGERLISDNATRASIRGATWQGALAYWPWGSGMGSYAAAFLPFQPAELGSYLIDPAHNEYLQALMELGAVFVVLAAVAVALVGRRLRQMARAAQAGQRAGAVAPWSEQDTLALACGLGLLATALHAWVDFPLRIPANAMFAAFLLGVFLREPEPKAQR